MGQLAVTPTDIPGLLVVRLDLQYNDDGWFKENWHRAKMVALGLPDFRPVQHNVTHVVDRGITRGFLAEPWDRLVSVVQGKAMGAWVDLREGPGFGRTWTCDLDPGTSVFVPRGVGNAHQVLADGTTFNYLMEHHWTPQARGNCATVDLFDPALAIGWPIPREQAIVAHRDRLHPPLAHATPMSARRTLVVGTETRLGRALLAEIPNASGLLTTELDPGAESEVDLSGFDTIINAHGDTGNGLGIPAWPRQSWATASARAQLLTRIARRHQLRYVHVSADCVFDRDTSAHTEDELLSLREAHGQGLAAAGLIAQTVPRHLVIRTGWVVGRDEGFIDTVATAARRGVRIELPAGQPGRLTFASQLAAGITHLLDSSAPAGTYNITGDGPLASWAQIVREIYRLRGADPALVVSLPPTAGSPGLQAPAVLDLARAKAHGWRSGNSWLMLADHLPGAGGAVAPAPARAPRDASTPVAAEPRPYRVLFVCTGNIARSAYAEVIARHDGPPGVEFSSAGTGAVVGHSIDAPMTPHLAGRGNPEAHQARQLTRELLEQADLVITMGAEHRRYILDAWPTLGRKAFVIGQVARELAGLPETVTLAGLADHLWRNRTSQPSDDVPDPHRRGPEAAAAASNLIDDRLNVILATLARLAPAVPR